ncbi:MAG TPA: AMP-binding protein [Burkholderiales bacterium]|nr:AMP-binding protein [Burkholderiales bacterium]
MSADFKSALPEAVWPALPAPGAAALAALLFQFERTQWWPAQMLLDHQLQQLAQTLKHAWDTAPFYRRRLDAAGWRPGAALTCDDWRKLPLLTRRDIQDAGDELASRAVPAYCGNVTSTQTSGSTGEPVHLRRTQLDQLLWNAGTLREHLWHKRDLSGKLAAIRVLPKDVGLPPHGSAARGWDPASHELFGTGPAMLLSLTTDIATQVRWLREQNPDYLLTYPTNLGALLEQFARDGARLPRLRGVTTVGETVTPALRERCAEIWGAPITDIYSSQEFGYLALQCPDGGGYHVMAESALVEVLDARGEPCRPGEIGRLVISSLHNFATPLIRYELRDYAEVGAPCACGRGLPRLARIVGRNRNMVTLPDGRRHWPLLGFAEYRVIAPVRQYQLIQRAAEEIEVRLVTDRLLTADEEARLVKVIQDALGWPFRLRFAYFEREIPRGAGGKFEEFVSELEG